MKRTPCLRSLQGGLVGWILLVALKSGAGVPAVLNVPLQPPASPYVFVDVWGDAQIPSRPVNAPMLTHLQTIPGDNRSLVLVQRDGLLIRLPDGLESTTYHPMLDIKNRVT